MFEGFDGWLRVKDDSGSADQPRPYSVSEFLDHCNMILDREFADVYVEGEVASFKVNQGKWVFFDLKEEDLSLGCFLPLSLLRVALEDGMKIRILATPKLTRWGKFSLTVKKIVPVGEGSIKKSFELLKRKLTAEGLFDPAKKRALPSDLEAIGVISSTAAAGYHDFLKILENRWGGLKVYTINTQVQGMSVPDQIVRALDAFNQAGKVGVIAILRGGGSANDLAVFNDEYLVRAIAASRIPVLTGIGHEVDESLADLAADRRASTPSNAAEILVPDRRAVAAQVSRLCRQMQRAFLDQISERATRCESQLVEARRELTHRLDGSLQLVRELRRSLSSFDPEAVLRRGYAIIRSAGAEDDFSPGAKITIDTYTKTLTAEVTHVETRS